MTGQPMLLIDYLQNYRKDKISMVKITLHREVTFIIKQNIKYDFIYFYVFY